MKIDQLKNIWEKDNVSQTPEITIEQKKEIHLPLERIRKNMRMEFWSSVIAILGILLYLVLYEPDFRLKIYGIILTGSAIIVTGFYFNKFFLLYKEIAEQKFSTREMLKDLKNQFELNKQYYVSYYIAFVPFLVAAYILIFDKQAGLQKYPEFVFVVALLLIVVAAITVLFFFGKWWFNEYYGKYIKQIENLAETLE